MAEYSNENSGALFRNEDKDDEHPNWADYQGSINVDGTDYWISAWLKTSKAGKKFMSLSVKSKDSQRAPNPAKQQPAQSNDFDDEIPFR